MNRIQNTRPAAVRRRWIFGCMLAATALMSTVPVGAVEGSAQTSLEQWLLRRLNQPTEHERAHERDGNVYIYDGLTDREVDQALNEHFDRIEYMMFLGTRKTIPTETANSNAQSNVETESPGCM
ncbi:MAG: hypothetical protein K0M48_00040 [Thiobacillus sp.]|nr:hypothetical protein [Thiobacillus sp.]